MDNEIIDHFKMKLLQNPKRIMDETGQIHEIYNQPDSSKREDHTLVYVDEKGNKTPIRDLSNPEYGCGTRDS